MLTWLNVKLALERLGVKAGDSIITHSSLKSLGELEDGAETVVRGMREAVGENGTVIFPTLCQEDWEHVYKNWHLDAHSDIGYLTNYFRRLPGAKRSDQASHSVAAMGKYADFITETHGQTGKRHGIFGDTPFAADSPWEKMYHLDTKILFLGVGASKCTFRHYAEYVFVEECLNRAKKSPNYEAIFDKVWTYEKDGKYVWDQYGVWPHIVNTTVESLLEAEGKVKRTQCGNVVIMMFSAKDFVDTCFKHLKLRTPGLLGGDEYPKFYPWLDEIDNEVNK